MARSPAHAHILVYGRVFRLGCLGRAGLRCAYQRDADGSRRYISDCCVVASFLGGALLIGRVCSGYLLGRFFAPRVAAFFFSGAALGIVLTSTSGPRWLAFAPAVLLGLGLGAEVDIIAYLISRYFGLRSFAEIYSYAWAAFGIAQATGPYLMGLGFARTRSYALPLTIFFFAAVLAAMLMMILGQYRYGPCVAAAPQPQAQPEIAAG